MSLHPADPEPPAPAQALVSDLFLSKVAELIHTTLHKMPRLSEPGPLGTRAEHWYDFGSLAGNSNLFVQVVCPHCCCLSSTLCAAVSQGRTDHATRQTHGWAQTTSHGVLSPQIRSQVSRCCREGISCQMSGPLQYGAGRPDGANIAEADASRVLVALDLKAAFQNVPRRAMLYSIEQNDADLAAVFSKWYTGTTEHRMHCDSVYTKISANSGVDQGCPLSTCGFSAAIDPVLMSVLADICRQYDPGAKLFAYLDDWYLWIKPQCLLQTIDVNTAATRSVNLALQSTKTQVWRASCQDPHSC